MLFFMVFLLIIYVRMLHRLKFGILEYKIMTADFDDKK